MCNGIAATGGGRKSAAVTDYSYNSRRLTEQSVRENEIIDQDQDRSGTVNCGKWAVLSECERRLHKFAKRIYCGKEWCEVCGTHRSASHNRKIARILPKAQQIKTMGYFVIEFPNWVRKLGSRGIYPDDTENKYWCYSKVDLQATTNSIVKIMGGKRTSAKRRAGGYFKRGLIRWHWFGDKNQAHYNPHINILVDSAFIEKEKLSEIKEALRSELKLPDLIVNYSYCDMPAKMFHKVEYITRATFLNREWNPYMSQELFNFRNQRWWGKWDDEPAWTVNQASEKDESELLMISKLQKTDCPCCDDGTGLLKRRSLNSGKMVAWSRPVDSTWLFIWGAREIAGAGYYIIPNSEGPLSPDHALTIRDIIFNDRSKDLKINNKGET